MEHDTKDIVAMAAMGQERGAAQVTQHGEAGPLKALEKVSDMSLNVKEIITDDHVHNKSMLR